MSQPRLGPAPAFGPGARERRLSAVPMSARPYAVPGYDGRAALPVTDDDVRLLGLLAEGMSIDSIARRLSLSDRTVRRRSRAICDRIGARAPIQAVAWAARNGLI